MNRDHGRPASSKPEPAAPEVAAPSHAERCRTLVAQTRVATLCTVAREPEGYPYGSLVTVAFDDEGRPLMLLSTMAEHTGNLAARPEASILVAEALGEGGDPLALGRATLLGPCRKVTGEPAAALRERFLAAHPRASYYVDFKDFAFYRLEVTALRYIGGFGRMSWVTVEDYRAAAPDPLAAASAGILSHMNEDHTEAMLAYARALANIPDASSATMTAVDRYGFEMTVVTPEGPRATRLAFDAPVATTDEVRRAMVSLVKVARAKAAG